MTGFLFAFLATLLAALGARDQLLVAQLAKAQGQRVALLAVALACALGASAAAAKLAAVLLGAEFAGQPAARFIFAGLSLVLAGGEALLLGARRAPEEPTRSLFAAGVVLLAQQVTDAVRFLILGLALATSAPVPAGMGGAAGSMAALAAAWAFPELGGHPRLGLLRRMAGLFLLLAGALLIWRGLP